MKWKLRSLLGGNRSAKATWEKQSYSQSGEDLIMDHILTDLQIVQPSYIDIGAHHPRYINNTFLMYTKGSKGINIEPDPTLFADFQQMRGRDTNLNIGVGEKSGQADFYIMNEPALNTFMKDEADRVSAENPAYFINKVSKIELRTVAEIVNEYSNGVFPDVLSIDVEGLDEIILRSMNYESSLPGIMCVETVSFSTKGRGVKKTDLIEFIASKGYIAYADTFINTIFVRKDLWLR